MASGEMKCIPVVVDNLTTDSAIAALSARQGKVLNEGKVGKLSTYGQNVESIGLQINPPTGAKARLFVRGTNNKTYFVDLPYEA